MHCPSGNVHLLVLRGVAEVFIAEERVGRGAAAGAVAAARGRGGCCGGGGPRIVGDKRGRLRCLSRCHIHGEGGLRVRITASRPPESKPRGSTAVAVSVIVVAMILALAPETEQQLKDTDKEGDRPYGHVQQIGGRRIATITSIVGAPCHHVRADEHEEEAAAKPTSEEAELLAVQLRALELLEGGWGVMGHAWNAKAEVTCGSADALGPGP